MPRESTLLSLERMSNLLTITIFFGLGLFFVFFNMAIGGFLRPKVPLVDKGTAYECGELPIGQSWIQFDLRFYIIALIFLVFDVEVALFYPWAAVYKAVQLPALIDMLAFFAILLVGYVYLWRFGYLEWVRSSITTSLAATKTDPAATAALHELARKDPELKPNDYPTPASN